MECDDNKVDKVPLNGTLKKSTLKQVHTYDELPEEVRAALMGRLSRRTNKETTLAKMDQRFMMTVLVYLYHNRPALKSDIHADVSRNASMNDRLMTLVSLGLVKVYNTVRYNSNYIVLTPKGQRVARMIEDMMNVIENEPDDIDEFGIRREI